MKILFTHSYFLRLDPKQWKLGLPYAPLATIQAAAYMREKGFVVALHDVMFDRDTGSVAASIQKNQPDLFVIYDDGFNYLTKMCLTNMREAAWKMTAIARQQGCRVIVCSSDATDHFQKYLEAGADFIVLGEGEATLAELCFSLMNHADVSTVAGIAYVSEGNIITTPKRPVLRELDRLPLPAWDLVNLEPYKRTWKKNAGYFSINISTTRGCPFKCNWCAKPIYGNRYHARSPEHVMKEIAWLHELVGFDHIWFCDDIFGLKPGWVNTFADLVKDSGIRFRFRIQSRADLLVQQHYVQALARAGCEQVWMGAESGSQKILDAMDKGTTISQIREATQLLKQHQVKPCFFIQFGYLGETREDIEKTIDLIHELMPHEIGISVSYPLPGTLFYEKVKGQLQQKSNWTDSDELAMMFHSTYPAEFYKQLHRFVHCSYKKRLALRDLRFILRHPFDSGIQRWKKALTGLVLSPALFISGIRLRQLEKVNDHAQ